MKIPLIVIALIVLAVFGFLAMSDDVEPTTGRYPEARKVVDSVREEIRGYFSQHNSLPKDLSFITDQDLNNRIKKYNVTFNPHAKEIESSDNFTDFPDKLYRMTLGLLGDEKGRSVGNPGFTFEYEMPGDVSISE